MGGSWIHIRPLSSMTFSTLNMCPEPPWVTCDCLHSLPVSACGLWLTTPRRVVPRPTPSGGWWLLEAVRSAARRHAERRTCRRQHLQIHVSAGCSGVIGGQHPPAPARNTLRVHHVRTALA